jgi:hypothetical protein
MYIQGLCQSRLTGSVQPILPRTENTVPLLLVQLLPWGHVCLKSRYSPTALVYLLIKNLLPSNGRRFVTVTQHGFYTLQYT